LLSVGERTTFFAADPPKLYAERLAEQSAERQAESRAFGVARVVVADALVKVDLLWRPSLYEGLGVMPT
jgi:hypothetical protein